MTTKKRRPKLPSVKSPVREGQDLITLLLREALREVLEGDMSESFGAALASAQKTGKATGPAIPAGVW